MDLFYNSKMISQCLRPLGPKGGGIKYNNLRQIGLGKPIEKENGF
jgi:hypothetical protein